MTQTVQAKCPHCRNVLRIPSEWLDKAMRCKHCKKTFQAKAKSSDVPIAQPAHKAAPVAVAAGAPPAKASGDPFGFDDGAAPTPASAPRRRSNGRGLLVL